MNKQTMILGLFAAFFSFASFTADTFLIVEFENSRYQTVSVNIGLEPLDPYEDNHNPVRYLQGVSGETWEARSKAVYGRTAYNLSVITTETLRNLAYLSAGLFFIFFAWQFKKDLITHLEEKIRKELREENEK